MKQLIKKILFIINSWKIIIIILLVIGGLFYWYQIKPSQIYSFCNYKAQEDAKESLKNKVEIESNSFYEKAVEKELYLKDDYEYYYKQCLREMGLKK